MEWKMGIVYYGIHELVALKMRDKYNLEIFVETGTWHGDSAIWAAAHFSKVYTIELNLPFLEEFNSLLADFDNIEPIHGNSRIELIPVISKIHRPVLFFLDAHWTGDAEQHDKISACPVMDEINTINKLCKVNHVIIVDDARLMRGKWGDQDSIVEALCNNEQRKVQIFDDIFLAEPENDN